MKTIAFAISAIFAYGISFGALTPATVHDDIPGNATIGEIVAASGVKPDLNTNAVKGIVDDSFRGGTQEVNRVTGSFDGISNRVGMIESKEVYWDGKQDAIDDYASTNAVRDIASSASVTNAGAVAEAKAYTDTHTPGNYATVSNRAMTAVQPTAISDMETQTHAAATYQPKGSYLTSETDPTISSWAKATTKPTYGWEEITNTPTALPNPNALSFYSKSGTLISSYDGSESKSVIMEDADFQAWRNSKNLYLGENSHSTGEDYSVALGVGTEASGTHSVALGAGGVRATAMHALAVGNSVEARAIASTAIGYSSFANAQSSTAIGGNAYANMERALAAGWAAVVDSTNATAIGNGAAVLTNALGATAIGSGAVVGNGATNAVQIGFGVNNEAGTLQFMDKKVAFISDIGNYKTVSNRAIRAVQSEILLAPGGGTRNIISPYRIWPGSPNRIYGDSLAVDLTDGKTSYGVVDQLGNYTPFALSNVIDHTNTMFSNEVLQVSLELFDTNTVAVLNDLAGTVDGIPLEGGAASIGTILLALLAAVAWLKKNKIGANDVKRVYNVNGTQYIDGDGGVYKADVELGGHWTLKQLNYTYIAKYKGRREVAGNPYYWVTDDGNRYIHYTPETGKISINGNQATPSAPVNLNPEHGDDFPGTFSYSNWTAVFTKQQSVFPSEPQDKIAKKSELDGKADEVKPSFSTITLNGVDYTEWTLGTRSGKIMLSVDMGGISTEISAFNPVTGVFESAPSQYRDTLRFDREAPVVGTSPTLFDHVARESALSGKANSSDIPSLSGQTFDISVDAQFKNMCILTARALGAVVTHTTDDTSTGGQVAQAYGITPTDATTFGELQTKAGLGDSAVLGDL